MPWILGWIDRTNKPGDHRIRTDEVRIRLIISCNLIVQFHVRHKSGRRAIQADGIMDDNFGFHLLYCDILHEINVS